LRIDLRTAKALGLNEYAHWARGQGDRIAGHVRYWPLADIGQPLVHPFRVLPRVGTMLLTLGGQQ
jgi:hypothetical protein